MTETPDVGILGETRFEDDGEGLDTVFFSRRSMLLMEKKNRKNERSTAMSATLRHTKYCARQFLRGRWPWLTQTQAQAVRRN